VNEEIELIKKDYIEYPEKYEKRVFDIYIELKKNKDMYNKKELLDTMVTLANIMIYYPEVKLGIESSDFGIELSKLNNNQNMEDFLFYKAMYKSANWDDVEEIKKIYKESIRYALLNENKEILTAAYSFLGDLYALEGNLKESLDYYQKAQENYKTPTELLKIKHGISMLFYKLGVHELAIENLLEMLKIIDENEKLDVAKKDYQIIIYQMLSLSYIKMKDYENALKYAHKNVILSKNYYDTHFEINSYLIYAGVAAQLDKNKEAEKYIEKTKNMIFGTDYEKNHLLIYNYYFAKYYNQFSKKNYEKAKEYLKKLEKYLAENDPNSLNGIYDRLSIILKKVGEFEEALKYQQKYTEYYIDFRNQKESLLSLFLHENYKEASLSTQIKKLEKEKLEAEKKITKQLTEKIEKEKRLYQLLLIIVLISILMIYVYIYYIKHKKISITDGLTETLNRRFAVNKIESLIKKNKDFSLILLDLDYFKKINDTYGHDVGDKTLIKVSEIVKNKLRKNEFLCRLGGEEFIIISENDDFELAERIRKEIARTDFETVNKITASFGVININKKNKNTFNQIYNELDKKLYEAKKSGRNKVFY
tara:strand:+ start:1668 stop:3443 length:1776 start_codon:yes stop_codon:yes gene_type:complete